jgi:K+-sensing histidine kinase KdpD
LLAKKTIYEEGVKMKFKIETGSFWFDINAIVVVLTIAIALGIWIRYTVVNWATHSWLLLFLLLVLPAHSLGLIWYSFIKMRRLKKESTGNKLSW